MFTSAERRNKTARIILSICLPWLFTVAAYLGFNSGLAIAGGSILASGLMNLLGAGIRLFIDIVMRQETWQSPNWKLGLKGGLGIVLIALPLWLAYVVVGPTGAVVILVYDLLLLLVTFLGHRLGVSVKMHQTVRVVALLITVAVLFRLVVHSEVLHWPFIVFVLVVLTACGYILFNQAVRDAKGTVSTQIVINLTGGIILSILGILWLVLHPVPIQNVVNSVKNAGFGIVLGAISIYAIVRGLSMINHRLDLRETDPMNADLRWMTMILVYEGLVMFSWTVSLLFKKPVSPFDILLSGVILLLIGVKVWLQLTRH